MTLLCTCIFSIKFVKNLVSKLHLAWFMAEIEPYSFEPSRDSLESEEDVIAI